MFTAVVAVFGAFAESGIFSDIDIIGDIIGNGITATDLLDGIFFTMACVAAILLPRRLKDVYDRAAWKPKIGGREAIVVIGWVALIANIYLDLIILGEFGVFDPLLVDGNAIPFAPPIIPNIDSLTGIGVDFVDFNWGFWTVFVLVVIGAVIYFFMRSYYSRRGVDFTTIYASIPPE